MRESFVQQFAAGDRLQVFDRQMYAFACIAERRVYVEVAAAAGDEVVYPFDHVK